MEVQPDVFRRLGWYLGWNSQGIGVPNFQYDVDVWEQEHTWNYNVNLRAECNPSICIHSPRDLYNTTSRILQRTSAARAERIIDSAIYVIPYRGGMEIFMSFNDLNHPIKDIDLLIQGINRRFDSWKKSEHSQNF